MATINIPDFYIGQQKQQPYTPPKGNVSGLLGGIGSVFNSLGSLGQQGQKTMAQHAQTAQPRPQSQITGLNIPFLGINAQSPNDNTKPQNTNLPASQTKKVEQKTQQSTEGGTTGSLSYGGPQTIGGKNMATSGQETATQTFPFNNPPPPGTNPTGSTQNTGTYTAINPLNGQPMAVPNGAVVNSDGTIAYSFGAPGGPQPTQAQTQQFTPNNGLYGQLVTALANAPQNNQAVNQAIQNLQQLRANYAQATQNIQGSPIDMSLATGQQGLLANRFATLQNAAQSSLSSALQSQQLQQSALGTAAGLAAPQFPAYTQAQFNPATGQYGTVGGGQYGSGPAAAANIGSIQDQTAQVNAWSANRQSVNNIVEMVCHA